ncbi:MAG: leucine-rich repeat domain-containing protein, partial [Treponema lecithinolyticum]
LKHLECAISKLTELNIQGCTALQRLDCKHNQLTADAFTKIFTDLPQRTVSQDAKCYLYTEESGVSEGNHKDFTSPGELKTAFDNAKNVKNWKMYKYAGNGNYVEL